MNKNFRIYRKDGLYLEQDGKTICITDACLKHYGYTSNDHEIILCYEEHDGSVMQKKVNDELVSTEIILCSKNKKFQNRELYIECPEKELYLFFSSYYKGKKMILYYRKAQPVRVFDFCDDVPFQTLRLQNGSILVLYQKGGTLGYSLLSDDCFSNFFPVAAKNPIKIFEWHKKLYLLTLEEQYILYNLTENKRYPLPLVFHKKPTLFFQESCIELRYRFYHKHVIYALINEEILFLREEDILDEHH
ncbi:MAG: hypothetical protein IJ278_04395 [Clostridia bacterium]|nr:hypothetical protein [Clostridia bacterium]